MRFPVVCVSGTLCEVESHTQCRQAGTLLRLLWPIPAQTCPKWMPWQFFPLESKPSIVRTFVKKPGGTFPSAEQAVSIVPQPEQPCVCSQGEHCFWEQIVRT